MKYETVTSCAAKITLNAIYVHTFEMVNYDTWWTYFELQTPTPPAQSISCGYNNSLKDRNLVDIFRKKFSLDLSRGMLVNHTHVGAFIMLLT